MDEGEEYEEVIPFAQRLLDEIRGVCKLDRVTFGIIARHTLEILDAAYFKGWEEGQRMAALDGMR